MSQHKTNPNVQLAKEGKLPPREKIPTKAQLKRKINEMMMKKIREGISKEVDETEESVV